MTIIVAADLHLCDLCLQYWHLRPSALCSMLWCTTSDRLFATDLEIPVRVAGTQQ